MAGTKKYTTEMLKNIVAQFFSQNVVIGQVNYKDIAEFANKIPGYEKVRYNTFSRDKEVKAIIDNANNYVYTGKDTGTLTMVNVNADAIMDTHDETTVKMIFRQVADRHNELNQMVVDLRTTVDASNVKIKELEDQIKKLKEKNKELRSSNDALSNLNKRLGRFKVFEEQVAMREFLDSRGLFSKLDKENLSILLTKSGFINEENVDVNTSVVETAITTCDIKNDEKNEVDSNALALNDKKTEKKNNASAMITELEALFKK